MLQISFSDYAYRASHLTAPKGRGSWGFAENYRQSDKAIFSPSMTLTEAKKWLVAKLKAEGVTGVHTVYIMP